VTGRIAPAISDRASWRALRVLGAAGRVGWYRPRECVTLGRTVSLLSAPDLPVKQKNNNLSREFEYFHPPLSGRMDSKRPPIETRLNPSRSEKYPE
jgi:hypothetical protein